MDRGEDERRVGVDTIVARLTKKVRLNWLKVRTRMSDCLVQILKKYIFMYDLAKILLSHYNILFDQGNISSNTPVQMLS